MNTENLQTLKIHKLSQAQYNRELEAGNINENEIYLTPDEEIKVPTKTSELENDSGFVTESGVPAVHTLPTDAKDGDMCLYAPQNTFTLADSGKRIYFDWEEFAKPVNEDEWTSFGVACYNHSTDVVSLEMSLYRGTQTCQLNIVRMFNSYEMDGFDLSFAAGELDTENSNYGDKDGVQTFFNSIDELPPYIDIPEFDQIDGNGLEDGNAYLFHTEYKLMKYQGGEWVEAVEVDVSDFATKEYVDSLFAAVADIKNYLGIE